MQLNWKAAWTAAWRTATDAFVAAFVAAFGLFTVTGVTTNPGEFAALGTVFIAAAISGVLAGFVSGASTLVEGTKAGYQAGGAQAFLTGFVRTGLQTLIGTAGALQALTATEVISATGWDIVATGAVNAVIAGVLSGITLLRKVPDAYVEDTTPVSNG